MSEHSTARRCSPTEGSWGVGDWCSIEVSGAGERGTTIYSEWWHLGRTGALSSCLKIYKFPLHPKDWVSWKFILVWECIQAKHNVRLPQPLEISVWFQGFQVSCRPLPSQGKAAEEGMAQHGSVLRDVNGCWRRRIFCYSLKPGTDITSLHWVILIWWSLLYSNLITLGWYQE